MSTFWKANGDPASAFRGFQEPAQGQLHGRFASSGAAARVVLEAWMTVTGLPTTVRERYVTRVELAQIMGVSVKSVDRLVAAGMPSVTWGLRARRFLPSVALAWAVGRGLGCGDGFDERRAS